MTNVERVFLSPVRARALAVALNDLMHFVEAGSTADEGVSVFLAVAMDEDSLVIGLGVDGGVEPVSSGEASRSLLRASAIVRLLNGDFQRGFDRGRMVFGLTFPRAFTAEFQT